MLLTFLFLEIKLQNQVQKKEVEAADNLLDDCFTEDIASLRILNEVTQVNTSPPPGLPSPPAKRAQPENCSLHANILADSNSASADRISSSLNISAKRRIVSVDDLISEEHYPPSWDIIEEEKITSDNSTKIESPFLSSFPSIPSPFSTIDLANTGDALDNNSTSISHLINGYPLVNSIMEDSGVDIGLGMGIDMNRLSKSNIAGSRAGTSQFSLLDTFWNVDSALSSGNNYLATARVGSPTNASITSNATTTTSSTSVLYQHSSLMFSLEQYVQRLNELHDDLSPVDIGCPKEVFKELYFYCNTCNTHLDLKSYKLHRLNRRLKSHAISTFCSECVEYRDNFLFCPSCVNVEDRIPVACTECMPTLHDENIDVLYSGHAYDFEHPICFPCIEK